MKTRILALVLALMLLVPALALAADYETYHHSNYAIDYPADWNMLTRETIDDIINLAIDGGIPGMDASLLEGYKEQIEALDMALFLGEGGVNFNINYVDVGVALTNNMIIEMMLPSTIEQLQSMFADSTVLTPGEVYAVGDNEFVAMALAYKAGDQDGLMSQFYCVRGTIMYTITFTAPQLDQTGVDWLDSVIDHVLASFVTG